MNNKIGLLVVGFDSATFKIINHMIDEGLLPNLSKLISSGVSCTLESTIPPLSPAAWVTTLTSQNPGRHGVFDFRYLDNNQIHGRSNELVLSDAFSGKSIFDVLSKLGLRVGAFNIPLTYPPWPVNGVMVSGPVTPDLSKTYTYPLELAGKLGPMGHHIDPEQLNEFDTAAFIDEMIWSTKRHFEYGLKLLVEEGPFDLFWFHLHTIDSVQHRCWPDTDDLSKPPINKNDRNISIIREIYRLADEGLGECINVLGDESTVLVLSDHGASKRPEWSVRPNILLVQNGLATIDHPSSLNKIPRKFLRRLPFGSYKTRFRDGIDWSKTSAHSYPLTATVGGVVVNAKGRQPNGVVPARDFEATKCRITQILEKWREPVNNRSIVRRIWRREDIYTGINVEKAPDLIFLVDTNFMVDGAVNGTEVELSTPRSKSGWSGIHDMEGVLVARGPSIRNGKRLDRARLLDIAPTIMYSLGLPIPKHFEGDILKEMFTKKYNKSQSKKNEARINVGAENSASLKLTDSEHRAMIDRLKSLGYIE